ncbi:hypothetical protein PI23P_08335 [Polaribacter irgensii 23-P]|uniref:Lipoprotein n=1 Tax=Polaribacter irgensii 23-P TaxID=313594 RepID=A4BZM6_9FLAO|nr:hypothetical protein [Polaribacter irgensii]EAR12619.1 hypothetical protein PI23P_08335 [Polaribacter irgensii 23-P]
MKKIFYLSILIFLGCKNQTNSKIDVYQNDNIVIANQFIDAFYSFNEDSLKLSLSYAEKSHPSILYYQKWAECGNYEVLNRADCEIKNDSLVICPVTVKDDLMSALELDLNVTDTFHIIIKDKKIRSVKTSSNDPVVYYKAKDWIKQNRPELIEKPCEDAWEGGPTPCECIKATIQGLAEFKANEESQKTQ